MRRTSLALLAGAALTLSACSDDAVSPARIEGAGAPLLSAAAGRGIEGEYIVVLKEGANPRSVAALVGAEPRHVYDAAFNGFAGSLNQGQLNAVLHNPAVEYVEQDQLFEITATQSGATWGIDRIDQRDRPLSGTYTYNNTASTVYAYVIDTGINAGHTNFGGRAQAVYDATGGNGADCNGHGTHVAGTIGSTTYGVAKNVRIRAVRVGQCASSLVGSNILAGINWTINNHIDPAVANLSLGGGGTTFNTATQNLINAGVFVAVAAGNSNANACSFTPASVSAAMTVAASTSTDARASYSNYGSCVDLYAPGSSIRSTWIGSTSATNTISGTSMASPHVAGVAALYKGTYGNASQSTINSWLINNASTNKISGNITGTPNRLLYKAGL